MGSSAHRRPLRPRFLLALLVVVAAVLRFGGLAAQSFWLDEYLWTQGSAAPVHDILRLADGYPPLFGLLVHGLLQLGLESDWWLRAPSALAGTLVVPVTYAVGRRVGGHTPALAAAALMALNPMAIWYSQECGAYALFLLTTLLSTLFFLRVLTSGGIRDAAGYAGAAFLGFGFHYYFVFVVAAHAMVAAWDGVRHAERRMRWMGLAVASALGFAVWGQAFVYDVGSQSVEDSGRPMSLLALPYTVFTFVGGFSLGPPLRALHATLYADTPVWAVVAPYSWVSLLTIATTAALALMALARRWTPARATTALLVLVPVFGAWLVSIVLVGYRPRYAVAALPLGAIWCASALRTRFRPAAAVLLVVLASLQLAAVKRIDDLAYAREDTRTAAAYVQSRGRDATVLLVGDAASTFDRYRGEGTRVVAFAPHDVRDDAALRARVEAVLAGRREVWLLSARPWTIDPKERVRTILDARFAAREEAHFAGVDLRRYVVAPTQTASTGGTRAPQIP